MPAVALLPAVHFNDIAAHPPDPAAAAMQYRGFEGGLAAARSAQEALDVFYRWDAARREFLTWSSLTELHFQQDTANERYKADNDLLNELRPKITGLDVSLKRAFLTCELRGELEAALGSYVFRRWELDVTAFDPTVEADTVRESELCDEYVELVAGATFEFEGERLNLSTIGKYKEHPDRSLREAASRATWQFFDEHAPVLDRIFSDLVDVRARIAAKLGFTTFTPLGYRRMLRTDYDADDVARYRRDIVRYIVPLATAIAREQANALGADPLMYWDEAVFGQEPSPRPPASFATFMERARGVFEGIGGNVGTFASLMIDGELVDLQSREAKASGGFCTSFPTYGLPYIFANFNGTTHDVNVLLHEMGHAYQGYESRGMPVSEYLWPTYEACEVHSMSMEFFGWPQLDRFFGADAERYRRQHLSASILFLPYGAAIDDFQHFVYEHPEAGAAQRNAYWKELEATYLPWRHYGGISHLENGGVWQAQRHVYLLPFYYIDYTLAMCCALQFWSRSIDDYDGALKAYVDLCRQGGSMPFQALVHSAGLRSPFETDVLKDVAERAAAFLAQTR